MESIDRGAMEPTQHKKWSEVRALNREQLRQLKDITAIYDRSEPIAVLIPYKRFLQMRKGFLAATAVVNRLTHKALGNVTTETMTAG